MHNLNTNERDFSPSTLPTDVLYTHWFDRPTLMHNFHWFATAYDSSTLCSPSNSWILFSESTKTQSSRHRKSIVTEIKYWLRAFGVIEEIKSYRSHKGAWIHNLQEPHTPKQKNLLPPDRLFHSCSERSSSRAFCKSGIARKTEPIAAAEHMLTRP